jgi:hypothetical protein
LLNSANSIIFADFPSLARFAFIDIQDKLSELFERTVDLNTPQDLSRYFRGRVLAEAEVYYEQPG